MSINRWMDREAVVYMHNGILLNHKKEHIWVSSDEVDEPRAYYTEWSESERQIWHSNAYIQKLRKWYWRVYLQGNSGETDIETRLTDMGRGEEKVGSMERVTRKLTLSYVMVITYGICSLAQETQTGALYQSRGVGWGGRWEGGSRGREYMCTHGWFMLRFDREQQNSVKQWSFS